jgi:uncharacterized Zn finger protein
MVSVLVYCGCGKNTGKECKVIKSGDIYKTVECTACGKVYTYSITDITKFKNWPIKKEG